MNRTQEVWYVFVAWEGLNPRALRLSCSGSTLKNDTFVQNTESSQKTTILILSDMKMSYLTTGH
jgi:hypothetical protein